MLKVIHETKDGFTFIGKTEGLITVLCQNKILHS